jgi:hypothetical protein
MTLTAQGDTFSYDDGSPSPGNKATAKMVAVANPDGSALNAAAEVDGYAQITDLAASSPLSEGGTVPTTATYAVIQAESQAVRWRDDGQAPTASVGMRIPAGGELFYDGNLSAIRFIEEAASAKLNVSYYH